MTTWCTCKFAVTNCRDFSPVLSPLWQLSTGPTKMVYLQICRNKLQGFFISAESTMTTQHLPDHNGVPDIANWLVQGSFIVCRVQYDNSALGPELNTPKFFSKTWLCSRRLAEQIFDGKKPTCVLASKFTEIARICQSGISEKCQSTDWNKNISSEQYAQY